MLVLSMVFPSNSVPGHNVESVCSGMHFRTLYARTLHMLEHHLFDMTRLSDRGVSLEKSLDQHEPLWEVWGSVQGFFGRSGRADQPDTV